MFEINTKTNFKIFEKISLPNKIPRRTLKKYRFKSPEIQIRHYEIPYKRFSTTDYIIKFFILIRALKKKSLGPPTKTSMWGKIFIGLFAFENP